MRHLSVYLACLSVAWVAVPVFAIKPFNDAFIKEYVKEGTPLADKVAAAKCNLCHEGKGKKMRNEFGKAVSKHLKKTDFGAGKKFDPKTEAVHKAIVDGLNKALAEKSADGKPFGDRVKAGELPAVSAEAK